MICTKCIHKDICEFYAYNGLRIPNMMQYGSDKCVAFKDKTSFIELPCLVIPDKNIKLKNTEPPYYLEIATTYKWKNVRLCMTLKEARRCEEQVRKEYKDLYGIEINESEDTE